jgi:MFS family permease
MTTTSTPAHHKAATPVQPQSNGLAISSLVLGILTFSGFLFLTGIPAIITGIMSLRRGQPERGMSIAGIILGAIGTFISFLLFLLLIFLIGFGVMNHTPTMQDGPSIDTMPAESTQT